MLKAPYRLALLALLLPFWAQAQFGGITYRKLNLCYISLNNTSEFQVTKAFVDRIQNLAGRKVIDVTEFQETGKSPEDTLKSIINKNVPCDGLVISGHHTGAFGGKNAGGSLGIEMLEKMACDRTTSWWFSSIRALWLQGCRTLGAIAEADRGEDLADFHANRVYQVRVEDGLRQNEWDLREEFATILDSETPYAARFLKVFYRAKVFGWTETAPGEKNSSDKSFVYHVHNTARLLAHDRTLFKNGGPFTSALTAPMANAYLRAIEVMLNPPRVGFSNYASITGWRNHGSPNKEKGIYGLDNPKLNAHRPLLSSHDSELLRSRDLECKMRSSMSAVEKRTALREVLKSESNIALSFYTLRDIVAEAKKDSDLIERKNLERELKSSPALANFLRRKLTAKNLGLARKIEYYGFFEDITGERNEELASSIHAQALVILKKTPEQNQYDLRDTKAKIFRAMAEANLLTAEEIRDVLMNTNDSAILEAALQAVADCPEIKPILNDVVSVGYQVALQKPDLLYTFVAKLMGIERPYDQVVVSLKDLMSRIESGTANKSLWGNFVTGITAKSYAAKNLDLNFIIRQALSVAPDKGEDPNYNFLRASLHKRVDVATRGLVLNQFFKNSVNTPHTPENFINRYQFVAEALSNPQVNPKDYPEALAYLKSGYSVQLARFDASGIVVLANAFKALAAAGDSQASELGRQTIEAAIESLGGGDYTFWMIYSMFNDKRSAKSYIPARTIRHVLEKTPANSFMPLLLIPALATSEYSSGVKMELLDMVDDHIRDPQYKLIAYFSMALSDLKDSEIRAKLDRIGKDPLLESPMTSLLGLAVSNIRPSLYPNVFQRMQLFERGARSNPGAWMGMKVAVLCDAKISAVTRHQYWNRWLSDPSFDADAIDLLGPSIVEMTGIRNFANYLDLLNRLVKHPRFTPELQKSYLEDLDEKEDETDLFSSSKFKLTDDQKNQIRQILSRPKSEGQ